MSIVGLSDYRARKSLEAFCIVVETQTRMTEAFFAHIHAEAWEVQRASRPTLKLITSKSGKDPIPGS